MICQRVFEIYNVYWILDDPLSVAASAQQPVDRWETDDFGKHYINRTNREGASVVQL